MDKTQLLPSRCSWSKQERQALPQEASSLEERHALIGETQFWHWKFPDPGENIFFAERASNLWAKTQALPSRCPYSDPAERPQV